MIRVLIFSLLVGCHTQNKENLISVLAPSDINLVTEDIQINSLSRCEKDISSDSIILIQLSNYNYDTIFVPLVDSKIGKWYLPETTAYLKEKNDTIYGLARSIGFSNATLFDTIAKNESKCYCMPAYNVTGETERFSHVQFSFPYYTSLSRGSLNHKILVRLNKEKKWVRKEEYIIPLKQIAHGDRVKITQELVLVYADP